MTTSCWRKSASNPCSWRGYICPARCTSGSPQLTLDTYCIASNLRSRHRQPNSMHLNPERGADHAGEGRTRTVKRDQSARMQESPKSWNASMLSCAKAQWLDRKWRLRGRKKQMHQGLGSVEVRLIVRLARELEFQSTDSFENRHPGHPRISNPNYTSVTSYAIYT